MAEPGATGPVCGNRRVQVTAQIGLAQTLVEQIHQCQQCGYTVEILADITYTKNDYFSPRSLTNPEACEYFFGRLKLFLYWNYERESGLSSSSP